MTTGAQMDYKPVKATPINQLLMYIALGHGHKELVNKLNSLRCGSYNVPLLTPLDLPWRVLSLRHSV